MTRKGKVYAAGLFYVLFLALIVLLCLVDRMPRGDGTEIGLATLNCGCFAAVALLNGSIDGNLELSMKLYKLTEYLGYFAILMLCVFALIGFLQLLRRRSLKKVDREILAMGGLFIVTLVIYVFFEKVVINCRPIIMPAESGFEPSFPSSHTVMSIVILGSAALVLKKYVPSPALCTLLRIACVLLILVMVCCRFLSGCHWFTDILGGVLVSLALLFLFSAVIENNGNQIG